MRTDSETAVVLLNEDGGIVDAHASCLQAFGWQREELIGKDIKEVLQYGRELLLNQLRLLESDDSSGNTSFSIRLLAKKKNQEQYPVRATVRRFDELGCWTVAFYRADSEMSDSNLAASISPQEIALAKRAMEEARANGKVVEKKRPETQKGEGLSSKLWRNSRLLFSSREDNKSAKVAENRDSEEAGKVLMQSAAPQPEPQAKEVILATPPQPPVTPAAPVVQEATPAVETKNPIPQNTPPTVPENVNRNEIPKPSVESMAMIARLKADLEKERSERLRIEQRATSLSSQVQNLHLQLSENLSVERQGEERISNLEGQLREAEAGLAHYKEAWEKEGMDRLSLEEQLGITNNLSAQLQENRDLMEKTRQQLEARQSELHKHIKDAQDLLKEREATLEKETEARQRSERSLTAALRENRELEQKHTLERGQLQTSLENAELQSRRAEEEVLRVRTEALGGARETRSRLGKLQGRFVNTVQSLNVLSNELLQGGVSDEHRHSFEAIIQELMSLETALAHETVPAGAQAAEEPQPELQVV